MNAEPQCGEALFPQPLIEPALQADTGRAEREDIFRGDPSPQRPLPRTPSPSSESSLSSGLGIRRSALGTVLELAINRWARARSGSSTASGSSSSFVLTHVLRPRRRHPSNATSALDVQSESLIRARRKARAERVLQREFVLSLPEALLPYAPRPVSIQRLPETTNQQRLLRTSSLSLVLGQLDSAIKRTARLRKPKQPHTTSPERGSETWFNDDMQLEPSFVASQVGALREDKGKAREKPRMMVAINRTQVPAVDKQLRKDQAWWLDVSNPTWSDMREIGKVLHLHPLTLDDISHQDPREKLELFPRLGYYFIVFRALQSEHKPSGTHNGADTNNSFGDTIISDTNVYIVVFREGICSFHFGDITSHVDRVRNKMLNLEEIAHMSADWIAHGILDSIVDDFFPLLKSIEKEVKDLDDLSISDGGLISQPRVEKRQELPDSNLALSKMPSNKLVVEDEEKIRSDSTCPEPKLTLWKKLRGKDGIPSCLLPFRGFGAVLPLQSLPRWMRPWSKSRRLPPPPSPLMRMTSTRRLVTSLARLLGTKSEVVSQLQKRLTNGTNIGPKSRRFEEALAVEVGIYLGDIQDHILTLQHSLAHYERKLSRSYPEHLLQLRVSILQARGDTDVAVMKLTVISLSIVAMQLVTAMLSLNVGRVPGNSRPTRAGPPNPSIYHWFGGVIVFVLCVGASIVSLSVHWWENAKRKYAQRSKH